MFIFNSVSHYFHLPFSFQDITKVCWNLCLQVLIMKFIHKFQQNEWYLENKKEMRNFERQYCRLNCYAHHDLMNHEFHAIVFIPPSKDGTYYGIALSVSIRPSVCPSVRPQLLVNAIYWKPLVGLTSHFDMALIPLRARTLLIWGILRKPRWPPQQFED